MVSDLEDSWPSAEYEWTVMVLKPVMRSTSTEKFPEASATAVCSPLSEMMSRVAPAVVVPERVVVSVETRASSSGVLMVSWLLAACGLLGVGEGMTEALGEGWGIFLRLWLAVQIPKVMIRPSANPIEIASTTSFFISGWRIS